METQKCNCPMCGITNEILYVDDELGNIYRCDCGKMWYFNPDKDGSMKRHYSN